MQIKSIFLHHIDVQTNIVTSIEIDDDAENLIDYVEKLVDDILDNANRRSYNWKDGHTQVKNSLIHLYEESDDVEEYVLENAKRLLEKEVKSQKLIAKLNIEIQKGSLLHLAIENNGVHQTIICKVEHDEVISEINFDLIRGLNTKKKLFKAILVHYDIDGNITHNYIHDKNSTKYWWDDFLELEKTKTDEENTENSLNDLDIAIGRYKKKYPSDHLILRNSLIGYYRSNENMNYTDMFDSIFKNYEPRDNDFPKKQLLKVIKSLPSKENFETQFPIIKSKINKRKNTKIKLANNLYLGFDGEVHNIENIIKTYSEGGNKYIRILSTEGYEKLKHLKSNND